MISFYFFPTILVMRVGSVWKFVYSVLRYVFSLFWKDSDTGNVKVLHSSNWNYEALSRMLREEKLSVPCAIVDLDALDRNIDKYKEMARKHKKNIRIATKSIRVPNLIQYIANRGGNAFHSVMCYNVNEAELLISSENNIFTDILIAYPFTRKEDVITTFSMASQHLRDPRLPKLYITVMVDCLYHLAKLSSTWDELLELSTRKIRDKQIKKQYKDLKLRICIDYDMSLCFIWNKIHMGAHRSPIYSIRKFKELLEALDDFPNLELVSIMGYEAQISGVPTNNPHTRWMNGIYRCFQWYSKKDVIKKCREMMKVIEQYGYNLEFVNGGGTGSFSWTVLDPHVSEVSVGSGFLHSSIFDWFEGNQNECALCFSLECTRVPKKGIITCQSGGFIASGSVCQDKSPSVFLPRKLMPLEEEGFGEVQTPLRGDSAYSMSIGDYVFLRPAKAGEIAERFNEYICKRGYSLQFSFPTYRGLGYCFF